MSKYIQKPLIFRLISVNFEHFNLIFEAFLFIYSDLLTFNIFIYILANIMILLIQS